MLLRSEHLRVPPAVSFAANVGIDRPDIRMNSLGSSVLQLTCFIRLETEAELEALDVDFMAFNVAFNLEKMGTSIRGT